MTTAQKRALDVLWPRYGVDATQGPLDLDALFGRRAPRILEIGFGMGDTLAELAQRHPEHDYLGIEVHQPGVGSLLVKLEAQDLDNVRVIASDAVEVLQDAIADASLAGIYIFFPDPWPKKRHHKRRLVQPDFAALLARKLRQGGRLHLATDWEDYARQMLEVLESNSDLHNCAGERCFSPRPEGRPVTKFERRGERLGHGVWDLVFVRRTGDGAFDDAMAGDGGGAPD